MSLISDFFLGIFIGYIGFTNTLAQTVQSFPQLEQQPNVTQLESASTETFLQQLPSQLQTIPDILLESAAYQQAAVGGSLVRTEATTSDPLEALVNIFCTFKTNEYVQTTTGTGFFIDPDGVIITNAHVAQFLLLAAAETAGDAECTVRTGSPASPSYTAALLYIPPAWVQENATILNDEVPMGTGERDYALLYVNSTTDGAPLPALFPALPYSSELLSNSFRNTSVTAAGYPASELLQNGAATALIARQASTSVSELYTFGSNRADVFSIRGSLVGAEGASGGPVLDQNGDVVGMIVTRGDDRLDGTGSLRAITLSHVHRTMLEETGFTLAEHLDGNIALRSQVFEETLTPFLLTMLQNAN